MLTKPGIIRGVLGGFILSLPFIFSCSEEKRHEMLTFFFDGVPPLGGEQEIEFVDPNAVPDPNSQPRRPEIIWYEHQVRLECQICHGDKKKRGFSRQVNLVAQVPELCYQCHKEYRDLPGRVHGPVAVGACMYCHEPHRTRNKYLLKNSIPELCYQCHEAEVIEFFDSKHADASYSNCNQCHEGHASENPSLLKMDWQETVSSSL